MLVGVFDRVTKVCVGVRDGVLVAADERDELAVPVDEAVVVFVDEDDAESTGWTMKASMASATGVRQAAEATRRFADQRRVSESSDVAGDTSRAIRYPAATKRKQRYIGCTCAPRGAGHWKLWAPMSRDIIPPRVSCHMATYGGLCSNRNEGLRHS